MPYRVRSTEVWFNMPGAVAAYQPIGAPEAFAARQNVSNDARRASLFRAVDGTAPTWARVTGWTFNGSNQYLKTGVLPNCGVGSLLLQYTSIANLNNSLAGCYNGGTFAQLLQYYNFNTMTAMNGTPGNVDHTPILTSGNYGVAGKTAYRDGVAEVTALAAGVAQATFDIYLGCGNLFGSPAQYAQYVLRAVLISHAPLAASAVRQAARQMAYCHVNPDWSAWGRRRRYYYAPSEVAAGLVFSPVGSGVVGSSVVRSVQ